VIKIKTRWFEADAVLMPWWVKPAGCIWKKGISIAFGPFGFSVTRT